MKLKYEAFATGIGEEWAVEAVDYEKEGIVYRTIFSGPNARKRAKEYAKWNKEKEEGKR